MDRTDEDRAAWLEPVADRLHEVRWLIDNSDGVLGLRLDGKPMPWADVIACYLPSWRP